MAVTWATQSKRGLFWHSAQEQRTFAYGSVSDWFPRVGVRDVQLNGFMRVPKNEEYALHHVPSLGYIYTDL